MKIQFSSWKNPELILLHVIGFGSRIFTWFVVQKALSEQGHSMQLCIECPWSELDLIKFSYNSWTANTGILFYACTSLVILRVVLHTRSLQCFCNFINMLQDATRSFVLRCYRLYKADKTCIYYYLDVKFNSYLVNHNQYGYIFYMTLLRPQNRHIYNLWEAF